MSERVRVWVFSFSFEISTSAILNRRLDDVLKVAAAAFMGSHLENWFVFDDALTPETSTYLVTTDSSSDDPSPGFTRTVDEWTDDMSAYESDYSARSATVGSTLHARRAGR